MTVLQPPRWGSRATGPDDIVRSAFMDNPTLGWTTAGLSSWFGIRSDVVQEAIDGLVADGIIHAAERDTYVFTPIIPVQQVSSSAG